MAAALIMLAGMRERTSPASVLAHEMMMLMIMIIDFDETTTTQFQQNYEVKNICNIAHGIRLSVCVSMPNVGETDGVDLNMIFIINKYVFQRALEV